MQEEGKKKRWEGGGGGLRKSEISIRPGIAIIDFHVFFGLLPFARYRCPSPFAISGVC